MTFMMNWVSKTSSFDIALNYPRLSDGSNYLMTWQGNVEYFWYHKDMFEKSRNY